MPAGTNVGLKGWVRRLRTPEERTRAVLLGVATAVLLLGEIFGRRGENEIGDVLVLGGIALAATLALLAHQLRPLAGIRALRLRQRWLRLQFRIRQSATEFGLDLRGTPPLPAAALRSRRRFIAILAAVNLAVLLLRQLEIDWRTVATHSLFLPYVLVLGVVWLGALLIVLLGANRIWGLIHLGLARWLPAARRRTRRRAILLFIAAFTVLSACAVLLPAWIPLTLALGSLAVLAVDVTRGAVPDFALVYRGSSGSPQSVRFREFLRLAVLALHLVWLPPVLVSIGAPGAITAVGGAASAWFGGVALATVTILIDLQLRASHRRDPARSSRTPLRVDREPSDIAKLRTAAARHRIIVRTPSESNAPRTIDEVRVELREAPARPDERRWPWPVTEAELCTNEFLEFVVRRDQAQARTRVLEAVGHTLGLAREQQFEQGCGFWVAPHQWCFPGLTRDEAERFSEERDWVFRDPMVGRPWHEQLTQHELHELHRVLTALEVDLIFVADEVTPRMFCAVLERLFERYDWGSHRRLEDRDLGFIAGVRLMIHTWESKRREPDGYPEPEYEQIGRARILHVFRDRNEQDDLADTPSSDIRMPRLGPVPLPL